MRIALGVLAVLAACASPPPPVAHPTATAPPAPATAPRVAHAPGLPSWIGARFDPASTAVLRVIPGAPAERGGLRAGDVVVSLDGRPATTATEIVERVRVLEPGVAVKVAILRANQPLTLTLVPEPRPEMDELVRQSLVGKPAPEFAAELVTGAYPARLADLKGNVIVLDFWATWCGPCAMTMPRLDALQTTYAARGLRIVGISNEDTADIQAFLADHKLSYTVARDAGAKIASDYLLQGVPMVIIIDRAGVVRDVHIGAQAFDEVDAAIVRLL